MQIFIEHRLARRLELDASQRTRLDQVLSDTRRHLQIIRQQYRSDVALVFSNANQQINEILTPEQRRRFDQIKAENAMFFHGLQLAP